MIGTVATRPHTRCKHRSAARLRTPKAGQKTFLYSGIPALSLWERVARSAG
jgi:hypothetical protein